MTARAQLRIQQETRCRRVAETIKSMLAVGEGFALLTFDFGDNENDPLSNISYVSSAERAGMMAALRELLSNLDRGEGPGGIAERVVELEREVAAWKAQDVANENEIERGRRELEHAWNRVHAHEGLNVELTDKLDRARERAAELVAAVSANGGASVDEQLAAVRATLLDVYDDEVSERASTLALAEQARLDLTEARTLDDGGIAVLRPVVEDETEVERRNAALVTELTVALDEARDLRARLALVSTGQDGVWMWQGDGNDDPESLSCPVVMPPATLRELLATHAIATEVPPELPTYLAGYWLADGKDWAGGKASDIEPDLLESVKGPDDDGR